MDASLEVVLQRPRDQSVADPVRREAGGLRVGIRRAQIAARAEVQRHVAIPVGVELRTRVVQEFKRREAEFHPLTFSHLEALEQCEIAVDERGSVDIGPDQSAILPLRRRREARWV